MSDNKKPQNALSRFFRGVSSFFTPKEPEGYTKPKKSDTAPANEASSSSGYTTKVEIAAPNKPAPHIVASQGIIETQHWYTPGTVKRSLTPLNPFDSALTLAALDELTSRPLERIDLNLPQYTTVLLLLKTQMATLPPTEPGKFEAMIWSRVQASFTSEFKPKTANVFEKAENPWKKELSQQLETVANQYQEYPLPLETTILLFLISLMLDSSDQSSTRELSRTSTFVKLVGPSLPLIQPLEILRQFVPLLSQLHMARRSANLKQSKELMELVLSLIRSNREMDLMGPLTHFFTGCVNQSIHPASIQALASKVVDLVSYHKGDINAYIVFAHSYCYRDMDDGKTGVFVGAVFKQFVTPLLKHLIVSPPPAAPLLFEDCFQELHLLRPLNWHDLIWDCIRDVNWNDETVPRLPGQFLPNVRTLVAPLSGSKITINLFSASPPREQLQHLAKDPSLRVHGQYFVFNLLKLLSENNDLFTVKPWEITNILNNSDYEALFVEVFPQLNQVTDTNPTLADLQSNAESLAFLNPQMLTVISVIVRRTVQRWSPDQFPRNFNETVAKLADPNRYSSHVRPGIVSIFVVHYLLEGLISFTQHDPTLLLKSDLKRLIPFLQWYEAIRDKSNQPTALKMLVEQSKGVYKDFRRRTSNFLQSTQDQNVTMDQVNCIINHTPVVSAIQKHWGLVSTEEETRVAQVMAMSLIEDVEQACAFKEWFDEVKVDIQVKAIKKEEVASLTIAQLRDIIDGFRRHLRESDFDAELEDCLKSFLLPQRSEIFSLVFRRVRTGLAGKITAKTLSKLVTDSCRYLQQLFSDDSRLSNLEQVWKIADQFGPTKLQKELEQLGEIVKRSDATIKISDLRSQIESGAKLRSYSETIIGLLDFFNALPTISASIPAFAQLSLESLDSINLVRRAANSLTDLPNLQVRELSGRLASVRSAVGELEPHTLKFFLTVVKNLDLIRFCHRADFRNKMDILTGQVQGMAFANDLLRSLSEVHTMLTPILTFESIPSLFVAIQGRIGAVSAEQLALNLRKFETCSNHINELRIYFSGTTGDSAATFLPTALRSLKRGRYLVRTSLHPQGHAVVLQQFQEHVENVVEVENDEENDDDEEYLGGRSLETSLEGHNLHGRLRGMTVFLDRSSLKDEEIDALTTFSDCYTLANDIAAQIERLVLSGHPSFQINAFPLGSGNSDMTVARYREVLETMKSYSTSWEESVSSMSEESPRLLFLDPKAIAAFLRALQRCGLDDRVRIGESLRPYLLRCFPEIHRPTSAAPLTEDMIEDCFQQVFDPERFGASKDDAEALCKLLLNYGGCILRILEEDPDVAALIEESGAPNLAKPRVVKAVGMHPVDLFKVTTQICERIPHASQILHCSKSLTSMDLMRFLGCAQKFHRLIFVVHGVNQLSHDLRQRLLSWSSEVASNPQATHASVVLLFTAERSGEDTFGFLHTESAKTLGFEYSEKVPAILHARNIMSFHCLHSRQGKSTTANQYLENLRYKLSLSFAEAFRPRDVSAVIEGIRSRGEDEKIIGLHIDIKPYTSLESVGRFLNEWLYFGVIYDPATGDAVYPTNVKWHIVVELTNPMKGDRDFGHLVPSAKSTTPPVLDHLPSVYNLRSGGASLPPSQLVVTPPMRLVAGLIETWNLPTFSQDPAVGSNLSDTKVQEIFDRQWGRISSLRRRHAIIELMCHSSAEFMRLYTLLRADYATLYYHTLVANGLNREAAALLKKIHGAKELYRMLLAEAEYLTDLSPNPVPVPLIIRKRVPNVQSYLKDEFRMGLAMESTVWEAISFGEPNPQLDATCPLPVVYFNREGHPQARSQQRMRLRATLADALGLENSSKMKHTIDRRGYVLTSNLANKMLHLHARRLSGNNIILVGDTGQGKTEMVDFYSLFLNMDSSEIPDLLEELAQLALRFIENMYPTKLHAFKVPQERSRSAIEQLFMDIAVSDKPLRPAPAVAAPSASPALAAQPSQPAQPPLPPPVHVPRLQDLTPAENDPDQRSCWPDLRETMKVWLARMIKQFPLLMVTPEIEQLLPQAYEAEIDEDDDDDDEDEEDVDVDREQPEQDEPLALDNALDFLDDDGEKELWKRDEFKSILGKMMTMRTRNLFHKQLMYKGLTLEAFSNKLQEATKCARDWPELTVLFFIDEANTTSFMGRLKDLMVDRRWDDEPLPPNFFIVAAVNPLEIDRAKGRDGLEMSRVDYSKHTNVETVAKSTSTFDVRLHHPSMDELFYHFTEMDETADDDFWEAMVELPGSDIQEDEKRTVIDYVLRGHQQLRLALIENMHPSIRDLVRALKLFNFFRKSALGAILLKEIPLEGTNPMKSTIDTSRQGTYSRHFWKALFMTVAVGYYLRLRNWAEDDPKPPASSRPALLRAINRMYETDPRRHQEVDFKTTLDSALIFMFSNTQIPPGIAATLALMENLFCTVICTDMKMPLTISGPAGCSKTLSFSIALDNMRGIGSAKPLFKFCQQIHHFRYQCSPMSSDAEIDAVYNEASSRQAGLAEAGGMDIREICTVLLDELNLAEKGSSQPLKVIHGKLDHPKVMTVILTNKLLDPAKTNRTLQIQQSVPTPDDLHALASSCLFDGTETSNYENAIVEGSVQAYGMIERTDNLGLNFQLRDFVYYLRSLRSTCRSALGVFNLTADLLLNSILRNFGGLLNPEKQRLVVETFFNTINEKIADTRGAQLVIPNLPSTPTSVLRESIQDVIPLLEMNPNVNSSRYLLVLDPTDSCTAVNLLFDMGIANRDRTAVIACSEFEEDASESGINERVMLMKDAMARGDTVVLVAADGIFGNFYDLFNKYFSIVPTDSAKDGQPQVTFFSNVAVGSISRPCRVHPQFKVIVHLPMSQLPNTPLPFLSRFEKYVLSMDHCLMEKMQISGLISAKFPAGKTHMDALVGGVRHFCETIHTHLPGQHPFHGFSDDQTVLSLALATLDCSAQGTILDPVPLPRMIRPGGADDTPAAPVRSEFSAQWIQHLIRMTNFRLLQLAHTSAACQMRFLPEEYLKEYFLRQEHLSASNLIRELMIQSGKAGGASLCRKWVISTRSSGELSRLHSDPELQSHMLDKTIGTLQYWSLSSVNSLAKINAKLVEFMKSGLDGLVICADMRTSTAPQINDLRRSIDNHVRGIDSHPMVFVLLHHPPEHSQSPQSAYPAIFWNHWDFYHTDSLGLLSTRDSDDDDGDDEEMAGDAASQTVYRVDAREWIAKSAGLNVEVSLEGVKEIFAKHFESEFRAVLRLAHLPPDKNFARLKHAKAIYLFFNAEKKKRENDIIRVLIAQPWIVDTMLSQFARHWTDALLHEIVTGTSSAIKEGKTAVGYVPLLRNSLRFMLISVCKDIIACLLSNYNMESLMLMLKELGDNEVASRAETKKAFLTLAFSIVPPPSLDTILASSSMDERVSKDESVFNFKIGKGIATELPLFDVVANVLKDAVANAMSRAGISSVHESLDRFVYTFSEDLHKKKELEDVLQLVDSNPEVQELFLNDFIHYQLGIPRLPTHLLGVIRSMLLSQAQSLHEKVSIMPAALFFLAPSIRNALSHAGLCLTPLTSLNVGVEDVDASFEERPSTDPTRMEVSVHTFSLTLLWRSLTEEIPDGVVEEDVSRRLWGWFVAMRDLHTRITSARLLKSCDDGDLRFWYHRMMLLFHAISSYELDASELLRLMKLDLVSGFDGLLQAEVQDLRSSLQRIEYICRVVAEVRGVSMDNLEMIDGTRRLVQSIVAQGIAFDPAVHETPRHGRDLIKNLQLLLKMMTNTCRDVPAPICSLLGDQWCLSQLAQLASTMVHLRSPDWFRELRRLNAEAIKDSRTINPNQYAPFVPFLTGEAAVMLGDKFKARNDADNGNGENVNAPSTVPIRTLVQPHDLPHHPLELIWFTLFSSMHKQLGSWHDHFALYESLAGSSQNDAVGHVERVSCVVSMIKMLADTLSSEKALLESENWIQDAIPFAKKTLFELHDLRDSKTLGLPADPIPLFFSSFKSTDALRWFLSTEEFVGGLGLEAWHVQEICEVQDSRMFRWMNLNEPKDRRFDMYGAICAVLEKDSSAGGLPGLIGVIDQFSTSPPHTTLDLRMVIVMALFQRFMSRGVACEVVRQNLGADAPLAQKLDLSTDLERKAILFMASGPRLNVAEKNEVEYHFSQKAFDSIGKLGDEALLLAMTLAATLGMPRDSNHMYTLMFNTTSVSRHQKMPGSTYRFHADCGFKADFAPGMPVLDAAPGIMGNVARHRLAFNATYWSSYCWAAILDPATTTAHSINPHMHILNDLAAHTPEEVVNYIFRRAFRFIMALEFESVDGKQSLNPVNYYSETLLSFQSIVNSPAEKRGVAWKSAFATDADLDAYHQAFQSQVSVPVDNNLDSRNQTYLEMIAATNSKLEYIVELRKSPTSAEFGLILPTSSLVLSLLSQRRLELNNRLLEIGGGVVENAEDAEIAPENPEKAEIEDEILLLDYIDEFLGVQVHLIANRLIPSFVQYLEALSSVFDGRLTAEQLTSMTLEEAFDFLIKNNLEDQSVVNRLNHLTYDFSENVKLFKMLVPILDGCPDGLRNREFEYEVSEIDPATTQLGLLIGLSIPGLASSNADRIRAMIKNLVDRHNACLSSRNRLSAIRNWNRNECLYNESSKVLVPLSALQQNTSNSEQNFAIITGDIPLAKRSDDQIMIPLCSPVLGLITSHIDPSSSRVDWRRVVERIAQVYSGGRHELMAMPELLVRPAEPSRARQINKMVHGAVSFLHLDYSSDLERVANELKELTGPTFRHYEDRPHWKASLRFNSNELQALCKHVYLIIGALVKKYDATNAFPTDIEKTIIELEKDAGQRPHAFPRRDTIFSKSGFFLYHLAMFLVELAQEYGFWYTDEDRANFEVDFSPEALAAFNLLRAELPQQANLRAFHEELTEISTKLSSEPVLRNALMRQVNEPLRVVIEVYKELNPDLVLRLLPDMITIAHFTTFLRKLQVLIQETSRLLAAAAPQVTEKDLYMEFVPERFIDTSPAGFRRAGGDFVPAPQQYELPPGERNIGEDWRIGDNMASAPVATVESYSLLFFQQMSNMKLGDIDRISASVAANNTSVASPVAVLTNPALIAARKELDAEKSLLLDSPVASSSGASSSSSSAPSASPSAVADSTPSRFGTTGEVTAPATTPVSPPRAIPFSLGPSPSIVQHPASILSAATASASASTQKNPLHISQPPPHNVMSLSSSHLPFPSYHLSSTGTPSTASPVNSNGPYAIPYAIPTHPQHPQHYLASGPLPYSMPQNPQAANAPGLPPSYVPIQALSGSYAPAYPPYNPQMQAFPEPDMSYASYQGANGSPIPPHQNPLFSNPMPSHQAPLMTTSTNNSSITSSTVQTLSVSSSAVASSPKDQFLQRWRASTKCDKPTALAKRLIHSSNWKTMARQGLAMFGSQMLEWSRSEENHLTKKLDDEERTFFHLALQLGNASFTSSLVESLHEASLLREMVNMKMASGETPGELANRMVAELALFPAIALEVCVEFRLVEILMASAVSSYVDTFHTLCRSLGEGERGNVENHLGKITTFSDAYDDEINFVWPE